MAGVYLSFPFCPHKCSFCNFASGVFPKDLEVSYGEALLAEVSQHRWDWTPETVYFGGGTPSHMELQLLQGLLLSIPGKPWREATIEALPGSLDAEHLTAWRKAGLNRLSLGVQSFIDAEVRRTGRLHNAETVQADCTRARASGFENLSLDLIAGLPGQTAVSWDQTLDWVEQIDPPHVSVYLLEVDEDSRLGLEILNGGARYGASDTPSDDENAVFYEMAIERLREMGLHRYEISNFARPGFESAHNLKYWTNQPYVGFGADAHSFDGYERTANVETAAEYVECRGRGQSPKTESNPAAPGEEKFFLGLRLSAGVTITAEEQRRHEPAIRRFVDGGLLRCEDSRLWLTPRGVLLSNEVLQEFLP